MAYRLCGLERDSLKTVITGDAGFIGSHLVRRLINEGREVVVADDFSRGSVRNLLDLGVRIECPRIDLRDYGRALGVVEGADVVYHLAARVGSVEYLHGSELAELRALQDNLVIDANVFRACVEAGVRKVIYASSVSVYPIDVQQKPGVVLSEDDLGSYSPEGGYGWAKLLGEMELGWMRGVDVGIARIFNVYGECEALDETAHVIPALMRKAILYPKEGFVVWGDGDQSRCLIYVSDCVDALTRLEEKASSSPITVNIGSDQEVSIRTLAEKIVGLSGKDIKMVFDPAKPTGPVSRTADISKAKALLGWQPRVSLDEGLQRTYLWAEKRLASTRRT